MSPDQRFVASSVGAALVWTVALYWVGLALVPPPAGPPLEIVARWMLPPALVLMAVIGAIANRRFFDAELIDGRAPPPGSAADIDRRALSNTVEQVLVSALVWSALAVQLPPERLGLIPALGCGLVLTRLCFWWGYRFAPRARAFGFAAGAYPNFVAALWALALLAGF